MFSTWCIAVCLRLVVHDKFCITFWSNWRVLQDDENNAFSKDNPLIYNDNSLMVIHLATDPIGRLDLRKAFLNLH